MSLNWCVEDTFTFKNFQRLEVNKKINDKFYQFRYRMNVGENNMIYNTHNPNAGKDEAKKYNYLEIYSNNVNLFQDSPPGIESSWGIERQDNNYYWDLSALYCTCSYSKSKPCSECDTCWKETQGDKLIYYEGSFGSLVIRPLSLLCETTGYFKPISFKWKDKTGTFKLKIEPTRNISDDVGEINQIDFKFYSYNFQKTIAEIIEKGNHMSICFDKERARIGLGYGYLRRGKTGNKVDWITPYCIEGWEKDELGFDKWLKIKEVSNASDHTKPTKNKSDNLSLAVLNSLKEYFQKNDIKSIKLVGDKWIVEYNHNQKNNEYPVSSAPTSEFQELKNYFSKTNKNEITLSELNGDTNSTNPNQNQPDNKILVGCIFGGIGLLIMGVVAAFIFKKKKVKKA